MHINILRKKNHIYLGYTRSWSIEFQMTEDKKGVWFCINDALCEGTTDASVKESDPNFVLGGDKKSLTYFSVQAALATSSASFSLGRFQQCIIFRQKSLWSWEIVVSISLSFIAMDWWIFLSLYDYIYYNFCNDEKVILLFSSLSLGHILLFTKQGEWIPSMSKVVDSKYDIDLTILTIHGRIIEMGLEQSMWKRISMLRHT